MYRTFVSFQKMSSDFLIASVFLGGNLSFIHVCSFGYSSVDRGENEQAEHLSVKLTIGQRMYVLKELMMFKVQCGCKEIVVFIFVCGHIR